MAEIDVVVAGRTYRLGCEDGQERHLASLAAGLDTEARTIADQTGTMQEGKVLLMAGLMLADRLAEATEALRAAQAALEGAPAAGDTAALSATLDRLEALVSTSEHAG